MRKREEIKETKEVTNYIETDVICNKCGRKKSEGQLAESEFQAVFLSFGYGSRYDGERWSFDLCEKCLTELVKTFKHVPEGFGEDSYYATYPQVMFDEWKGTGVVDLEAGMTAEEIAERGGSIYADGDEEEV